MFATVPTVGPQGDIFSVPGSASINDSKTSLVRIAVFMNFISLFYPPLYKYFP
ncbi:hypothetical protein SAMN05216386_0825 [Nitrosospira briensis]|uniref:Uncharacterized protein n=1 Tax=Nitrosospira briensis TaxID=35799 RepID=A0A1I4YQU9_9PROT|nr:hypothetical protein SAMN05216386_0825 [Nitrosospira briensis]